MDEFSAFGKEDGYRALSSTRDVTKSRFFNFTPQGTGNAAYDMTQTKIKKLRMHWSSHPEKNVGLYYRGGKARSPWYDEQCERAAHPMEIAQELDIDYLGSDFQFFDAETLDRVTREDCRPAYVTGELEFDPDTMEFRGFTKLPKGRWKLWIYPDAITDMESFAMGVDVATGTGSSNSIISIASCKRREKVAEFASPNVQPHELAKIAVAAAKWFRNAFLAWEANGPGRIFGDGVVNAGYRNVYYRQNDRVQFSKPSDTPGWYSTKENKLALLGEYRRALSSREFVNRSKESVSECREYVFLPGGGVEHSKSVVNIDPSGARANHGDRVVADALSWKAIRERGQVDKETAVLIPPGSLAARRQFHKNAEIKRKNAEW